MDRVQTEGAVYVLIVLVALCLNSVAHAQDYWSQTRRGANSFNLVETGAHLAEANAFGADFVRVAYGKWRGEGRDFLAGDLDHYEGLVAADVAHLRAILDAAAAGDVKVILTPLDLPGGRWAQNNNDTFDRRIWNDRTWWDVTARYWMDIAREFKGHPALAAYNIINEPSPERGTGFESEGDVAARDAWCASARDTAADLSRFYSYIVTAIRAIDETIPIVLDTGSYGAPLAVRCLTPIDDPHVIYSVHMYEPYRYTTLRLNQGQFAYPGPLPFGGETREWNAAAIAAHLQPLMDWADAHGVARDRLMLGEFGCARQVRGCADYLRDVIAAAEAARMHWAFYSFREDVWDGMDYELGADLAPGAFYFAREQGREPPRVDNPMARVMREALTR